MKLIKFLMIQVLVVSCNGTYNSSAEIKVEDVTTNLVEKDLSKVNESYLLSFKDSVHFCERILEVDSFYFGKLNAFDRKENVLQKLGTPDSVKIVDMDIGEEVIAEWMYYRSYHILVETTSNGDSDILIIYSDDSSISFGNGLPSIGERVDLLKPYFDSLAFENLILNGIGKLPFQKGSQGLDTWLVLEIDNLIIKSVSYDNTVF